MVYLSFLNHGSQRFVLNSAFDRILGYSLFSISLKTNNPTTAIGAETIISDHISSLLSSPTLYLSLSLSVSLSLAFSLSLSIYLSLFHSLSLSLSLPLSISSLSLSIFSSSIHLILCVILHLNPLL